MPGILKGQKKLWKQGVFRALPFLVYSSLTENISALIKIVPTLTEFISASIQITSSSI
jgi:hypothetical protein